MIACLELDLNPQLRFARGIVVLTNRKLLAKAAGDAAWQSWEFANGDYGLSREARAPTGGAEAVLVYGSGSEAQIQEFAGTLRARNATAAPSASPTS